MELMASIIPTTAMTGSITTCAGLDPEISSDMWNIQNTAVRTASTALTMSHKRREENSTHNIPATGSR